MNRRRLMEMGQRLGEEHGLGKLEGYDTELGYNSGPWLLPRRRSTRQRIAFLYSGGVARVQPGLIPPDVVPWADVELLTVTLATGPDGNPVPVFGYCVAGVRDPDGPAVKMDAPNAGPMAISAYRHAGQRILAPLIARYDAGQPVTLAKVLVDHEGVTLPSGMRLAWANLSWVTLRRLNDHPDGLPIVSLTFPLPAGARPGWRTATLNPSGAANGILVADLVTHAARRNGVEVRSGGS
jgi:hypothetical protein